ncbi:S8 family peptidase [Variovorax boronicumulans]|uniref:S8 family peptidase n=1 Tax=Variovorax boronicumulans TaxID=436515 RepID=UPI00278A70C3|nr:S8 family peptidase [Variovorax boronicumulans]MDQ0042821.1 hypothetical protein [Variovorax boronicumulans]
MATRFLIGRGELLTYDIPPPPIKPDKAHPYSLMEAKAHLLPQVVQSALQMRSLPDAACPLDYAVAKLDLHPAYIAKSFFPSAFLRQAGLAAVGSRTIKVTPRRELRKTAPETSESSQLFVAGPRESFERLPGVITQLNEGSREAIQFAEIEDLSAMVGGDRLRGAPSKNDHVFEAGLHMIPDQDVETLQRAFSGYAKRCGFAVNEELVFPVGKMLFVAATGDAGGLADLARFSMLRVVRPMPSLRGHRPIARSTPVRVSFSLPTAAPLSDEPKVAVLDGGLPESHGLERFVRRYERSDAEASDVADYLDHGHGVTSALLFGPIDPGESARRPFAYVDHVRVLDEGVDGEDPLELYRTLGHIEEVLLSRRYQFLNLSLGPNLCVEDTDVHAWTAVLDTQLSDGATLMTVAAGNNGESDSALGLDRVQVPADSVNALAVGAADRTTEAWTRAPYSARGPGRSPGVRKPDIVAFGGSPKEYFHVARAGARPALSASMGTSYAAPFALRTAVGVRTVLGEEIHPLTIKALLIHGARMEEHHAQVDVGWGRIPDDINDLIVCGDGMARIIYQGMLRPGKYLRAPVPLPKAPLEGKVELRATFCYACPVDVEDAAAYTKAGLGITFRPKASKLTKSKRNAATKSFFSAKEFRTEHEQRADLGKWETVMHASHNMYGSSLEEAAFDIHYNAREGGGSIGNRGELIPYALVLTVKARRHANLYEEILAAHVKLQAIEPRVTLPIRIGT